MTSLSRSLKSIIAVAALAASGLASAQSSTLLNVSYDVAREFYKDYNQAFVAHYKKTTGKDVKVDQAHGGSSARFETLPQRSIFRKILPLSIIPDAIHAFKASTGRPVR